MKIILRERKNYIIRLDKDDEIIEALTVFCTKHKIQSGFFIGLGAAKEAVLSDYNLKTKKYTDKLIKNGMEIVGLTGNIGKLDNKVIIHSHTVLSSFSKGITGGHVKKLVIGATCEIFIQVFSKAIKRKFSAEIGLNLMK